ncbi:MAG: GntR family transcriptional regulator [Clostridiales bacterium]|nr:GntR family transcriptional regulator [Clostridiales bacterium]
MKNNLNSTPLYIQVKDYINQQIAAGKYPVNSQLPTEHQFMEKLKVGRVTVRTALKQLEDEGKVVKRHGIGTFVAKSEKTIGFEPLLSLSYSLDKLGFQGKSSTVEIKHFTVEKDSVLADKWAEGTPIHLIKRIRFADNFPIGIESDYLVDEMFNQITPEQLDEIQSITTLMFYHLKLNITKLEEIFEFQKPDNYQKIQLALHNDERVLTLKRWLYCDNSSMPSAHIEFSIGERLIDVPFSAIKR